MSTYSFRTIEESVGTGGMIRPDGQQRSVTYHLTKVARVQHDPGVNDIEGIPELTIRLTSGYGLNGPATFVDKNGRRVEVDVEDDVVTILGSLK